MSWISKTLASGLKVVRVRYELPDTSAFVCYQPAYDKDPNNLNVHHYDGELPLSCSETGNFNLKELVNELRYAYVLVYLFPDESDMQFYLTGLDTGLAQLELIGGSYDFNRLWITSGISNLGVPMAIFLGKRHAVNGQPSVTLVDHRHQPVSAFRGLCPRDGRQLVCRGQGSDYCRVQVVLHSGGRPVSVLRRLPDVQPLRQHPAGR